MVKVKVGLSGSVAVNKTGIALSSFPLNDCDSAIGASLIGLMVILMVATLEFSILSLAR